MNRTLTFEEIVDLVYDSPDTTRVSGIALAEALRKDIRFSEEYEMTKEIKNLMDAMEFSPSEKTLKNILDFSKAARKKNQKLDRYFKETVN